MKFFFKPLPVTTFICKYMDKSSYIKGFGLQEYDKRYLARYISMNDTV